MLSLLPLAAALAAVAPQANDPGPVVLLGEEADASLVDELRGDFSARLLLRTYGGPADARPDCATLARALGCGAGTACRELPPDDLVAVDDAELAGAVRAAGLVAFGEGSLDLWFRTLWPRRIESELVRALWEAHRGGAVLVARGAGAGLLSAATVIDGPGDLALRERNPRKADGPRAAWAAGFQPWALLDTAGESGGSLERLLRVLIDERLRLGVMLEADGALVFDAAAERFVARAAGGVLIVDMRTSRRREEALFGARLSRLRAGDGWERRRRTVLPRRGAREVDVELREERREVEDVRSLAALCGALTAFEVEPAPNRLVLADGERTLALEVDESSAVWRSEDGAVTLERLTFELAPAVP